MFDIAFTTDVPELQEQGWYSLRGCTTLGEYRETFLAPISSWGRSDYERQWLDAAIRVLSDTGRAGFFTEAQRFWWTMWREGEAVFVHEEFITPERATATADSMVAPYHLIQDRVTSNEDGERVSEWRISADDLRKFVTRRRRQYTRPNNGLQGTDPRA